MTSVSRCQLVVNAWKGGPRSREKREENGILIFAAPAATYVSTLTQYWHLPSEFRQLPLNRNSFLRAPNKSEEVPSHFFSESTALLVSLQHQSLSSDAIQKQQTHYSQIRQANPDTSELPSIDSTPSNTKLNASHYRQE